VNTLFLPELLYTRGAFVRHGGLLVDNVGKVIDVPVQRDVTADLVIELPGKCLLPGFVNAHSHSFQRLIRGKAESRIVSGKDFWSWRGTMYHAAAQLDPREVFDVARMAFLEMALAGTTTVGEFHYLHTSPDGGTYEDPNLLAKQVIAAAQSVGIRIVLLRTAYLRSGFELPRDSGQTRFFETASDYLANIERLIGEYPNGSQVQFGAAPHSVRAVPLDALSKIMDWSRSKNLPIHMHVSEQVAENAESIREYGCTPIELLHREGLLGPDLTAVHAIHICQSEIATMAEAGASICACPTTERNLGDGVLAADAVMSAGIPVALGSDSQAQIDPMEDARELDYHLRLVHQKRAILDQIDGESMAVRLFRCATENGARALSVQTGDLTVTSMADFFTVDLDDISIAGFSDESLLSTLLFSLQRSAVRDVAVNGKLIVRNGKHALQEEIVGCYQQAHEKVWQNRNVGRSAE
jgi:formimidoylglutamate deiminase